MLFRAFAALLICALHLKKPSAVFATLFALFVVMNIHHSAYANSWVCEKVFVGPSGQSYSACNHAADACMSEGGITSPGFCYTVLSNGYSACPRPADGIYQWVTPDDTSGTAVRHHYACYLDASCPAPFIDFGSGACSPEYDPSKNLGPSRDVCLLENPIHPATGNKYQTETDYVAATGGLRFTRYYNSQSTKHFNESFGDKWSAEYFQHLKIVAGDFINVYHATGRKDMVQCPTVGSDCLTDNDVTFAIKKTSSGYTLTREDNVVEDYDSNGTLLSITNTHGQTQTLTYNGTTGLLETVTGPFNRTLSFTYDVNNRVITMIDPDNDIYTYAYTNDVLTSVTYPDNNSRTYHYEDTKWVHHLTGITDENNNRFSTYAYNTDGLATSSEHAGGANRVDVVYNTNGTTTATDALGASNTYTFEYKLGVSKTTDISGAQCGSCGSQAQAATYDTNGFVASRTDFNSNVTTYVHNSRGLQTSRTEASGSSKARTITTEWHSTLRLPTKITDHGKETTFTYNSTGALLTRTEKDLANNNTRTTTYTYDSNGNVLTINGPRTDVTDTTTFTYNSSGNRTSMKNALNQTTNYTSYDVHGRLLSMTDPNGVVTSMTYDARGRIKTNTVAGDTSSFDYDAAGNLTKITLPNASYLSYTYDNAHRLTQIKDNQNNKIIYTLDNDGNRTQEDVKDASGTLRRTQSRVFDQLSRMTQSIGGVNQTTVFGYDANGNQISVLDPLNRNSTSSYDALDRLITSTDPNSNNTSYAYDARDNLTSVTDARNLVTTYSYDGLDNLTQLVSPDTGTTTYTYDDAGNRLTQTDARNKTTTYTYDALNRLTSITYSDTTLNVAYTYDAGTNGKGRLTSMTDASGTTTYAYDAKGNVVTETKTISSQNYVTSYQYDDADNLTQITYPSGRTVDYSRNNIGQVTQVNTTFNGNTSVIANLISYLPFGPVKSLTLGSGLVTTLTYDQDYRLTDTVTGNSIQSLTLAYNAVNNITSITNNNDTTRNQSFTYDNLDRLLSGNGIYGNLSYTYDAVGNRLTETKGSTTDTYNYSSSSNQLQGITGGQILNFGHDANGNITSAGSDTFTVSDANRMKNMSDGSTTIHYTYNGKGERVKKVSGSTTTIYHYDQSGLLIAESDAQANFQIEYVYLNGQRIALIDATSTGGSSGSTEYIVDNSDSSNTSTTGQWNSATSGTGDYEGVDVQKHTMNSSETIIDNNDNAFSIVGTYTTWNIGSWYEGSNFHQLTPNSPDNSGTFVDNDSTSTSSVGSWTSFSCGGCYGSTLRQGVSGSGSDTYTWNIPITETKDYRVYVQWTQHSNRATDAPYTVHHTAGTTTIDVNQQINGSTWYELGTFNLDNSSKVVLSNDANGYVIADAVKVVATDSLGNGATWTIDVSTPGNYEVFTKWSTHSNRATNAQYKIFHENGDTTVTQNQQINGEQWISLGTYEFAPNSSNSVFISDQANGYIIVDSIRLVPTQDLSTFTWNLTNTGTFSYLVYAKWTQDASHSADASYTINHTTGQDTVTVNQQTNGTGWNLLGTYDMNETSSVTLNMGTFGDVIADAIKFVATATSGQGVHYIHTNHLDTPQVITDGNKNVVWSADYEPFGTTNITVNTLTNNLRFPGQYADSESGLNYNYFRDYNSGLGRYMQSDPIGLEGGVNTYSYVGLNPVVRIDQLGLFELVIPWNQTTIRPFPGQPIDPMIMPITPEQTGDIPLIGVENPLTGTKEFCPRKCGGLLKQLRKHEKKLQDFKTNPGIFDNKGFLANAAPDLRKKIVDGRINKLERQIKNFRKQYEACLRKSGFSI